MFSRNVYDLFYKIIISYLDLSVKEKVQLLELFFILSEKDFLHVKLIDFKLIDLVVFRDLD